MGPSGAGKSTLLDVLSGRALDRRLLVSGQWKQVGQRSTVAYLQQDDLLPERLTVREHLIFVSRLLADPTDQIEYRTLLLELGLAEVANQMISRLSGGQKRRLSLAAKVSECLYSNQMKCHTGALR